MNMLEWLTDAVDKDIREYCDYLSPDDGQDGYHDAIVNLLTQKAVVVPIRPQAYLRVATKCAVYKIWRHRKAEDSMVEAYTKGDGSPYTVGLVAGRKPHTHCRRGHELTKDNVLFMGANYTQRTCKTCRLLAKQKKGLQP